MTSSGSGTKTNRLESSLKLYSDNHIYKPTSTMLTRVGGRTLASIFHTLPCSTPFPTATPNSGSPYSGSPYSSSLQRLSLQQLPTAASLQRRNKTGPKRCVAAQHQANSEDSLQRRNKTGPKRCVAAQHQAIRKIPRSDATKPSQNVASRHS